MTVDTWPEHHLIGVPELDEQHQALFDLVDELCAQPALRTDAAKLAAFLNRLAERTREHFQTEEQIMAAYRYPRTGVHRVAHARLLAQLADVERRARLGEDLNFEGFLAFLKTWLFEHLGDEDRLMGDFLRGEPTVKLMAHRSTARH